MVTRAEAESLLSKLCIELGFCLSPEDEARLIESPPDTVEAFTDWVFIAEGLNPEYVDVICIGKCVIKWQKHFKKHLENDNAFDD